MRIKNWFLSGVFRLCLLQCLGESLRKSIHLPCSSTFHLIMGRTPHRGIFSHHCFLVASLLFFNLITEALRSNCRCDIFHHIIRIFDVGVCDLFHVSLELFQPHVLCRLYSHSNYSLCIRGSQILMSVSIIFWFQIKKRRTKDEAASQQALPSTNLMVGNSDLTLLLLHCSCFHYGLIEIFLTYSLIYLQLFLY